MDKKLACITGALLLFNGTLCMENRRVSIRDEFLIEEKDSSESLDDCKEISHAFSKTMYLSIHDEKLRKLIDKQDALWEKLWDNKTSAFHVLVAKDEKADACLAACVAYQIKAANKAYEIQMIARDPKYSKTKVLADLIDAIPLFHDDSDIQKLCTCIRKSALMRELLIDLGFSETTFVFDGCREDKWQGYEKILKKIK